MDSQQNPLVFPKESAQSLHETNRTSSLKFVILLTGMLLVLSLAVNVFQLTQVKDVNTINCKDNINATPSITQVVPSPIVNNTGIDNKYVKELVLANMGGIFFIPVDDTERLIKYSVPGIMIQLQGTTETTMYRFNGRHYLPSSDAENDMIAFTIEDIRFDPAEENSGYTNTNTTQLINGKVFNVFQSNSDQEVESCGILYTTKNSQDENVSFSLCFDRRYISEEELLITGDTAEAAAAEKLDYQTIVDTIMQSITVY